MLETIKLKPWSTDDSTNILDWCKLNDYEATKEPDGCIIVDIVKSGSNSSRSSLLQGLRKVAKYELKMSAMAESLLTELLRLVQIYE